MPSSSPTPPKASGTYGIGGLLRSPSKFVTALLVMFGRPVPDTADIADLEAVTKGEGRRVSCFMWGEASPSPQRFTLGHLDLMPDGARWSARRGPTVTIPPSVVSIGVRAVDGDHTPGERNVKARVFAIVTCTGGLGSVEFAVPKLDCALVSAYFEPKTQVPDSLA